MEHKVTTEKIQEAAKQCPDAKRVLETLFPDAFAPDCMPVVDSGTNSYVTTIGMHGSISRRKNGNYAGRGFYLPAQPHRMWKVVRDNEGQDVLISISLTV